MNGDDQPHLVAIVGAAAREFAGPTGAIDHMGAIRILAASITVFAGGLRDSCAAIDAAIEGLQAARAIYAIGDAARAARAS